MNKYEILILNKLSCELYFSLSIDISISKKVTENENLK